MTLPECVYIVFHRQITVSFLLVPFSTWIRPGTHSHVATWHSVDALMLSHNAVLQNSHLPSTKSHHSIVKEILTLQIMLRGLTVLVSLNAASGTNYSHHNVTVANYFNVAQHQVTM